MATKISHKVQEYQTLRPYLGNIPKKKQFSLNLWAVFHLSQTTSNDFDQD